MNSAKLRSLFNGLSPNYDRFNRLFSLGLDVSWRKQLVSAVVRQQPAKILDLACGSGDVTTRLLQTCPKAGVFGVDFSRPLLTLARKRGCPKLAEADALNLPFADASFDGVTLAFGLRNFTNRIEALREIARILCPGGVFGLLEFTPPPKPWNLFWNFYLTRLMPWVAQKVSGQGESFVYLAQSIAEFPVPSILQRELANSGFKLLFARNFSARLVRLTVWFRT